MHKYRAQLLGNELGVKIANGFLHDRFEVVEDNGEYFLVGDGLDNASTSEEVNALAEDATGQLNMVLSLVAGGYELKVNCIQELADDGSWKSSVAYGSVSINISAVLAVNPDNANYKLGQILFKQQQEKPAVEKALRMLLRKTPNSLYHAYEIIQQDMGMRGQWEQRRNWIAQSEEARFTQSVQSPDVYGDDARHATRITKPEDPMELAEACETMKKMLIGWVEYLDEVT